MKRSHFAVLFLAAALLILALPDSTSSQWEPPVPELVAEHTDIGEVVDIDVAGKKFLVQGSADPFVELYANPVTPGLVDVFETGRNYSELLLTADWAVAGSHDGLFGWRLDSGRSWKSPALDHARLLTKIDGDRFAFAWHQQFWVSYTDSAGGKWAVELPEVPVAAACSTTHCLVALPDDVVVVNIAGEKPAIETTIRGWHDGRMPGVHSIVELGNNSFWAADDERTYVILDHWGVSVASDNDSPVKSMVRSGPYVVVTTEATIDILYVGDGRFMASSKLAAQLPNGDQGITKAVVSDEFLLTIGWEQNLRAWKWREAHKVYLPLTVSR